MRRWSTSLPRLIGRRSTYTHRIAHLSNTCAERSASRPHDLPLPRHLRPYQVFQRVNPPTGKHAAHAISWLDLLEPCLPAHLRKPDTPANDDNLTTQPALTLNATDVAEIVVAASHHQDHNGNLDLLYELAVGQGRWRAVVWVTRLIAEAFAEPMPSTKDRTTRMFPAWNTTSSLRQLTAQVNGIAIDRDVHGWHLDGQMIAEKTSLDILTSDKPENLSREDLFRHDVWGCIWRALGRLTLACANQETSADGGMKLEILEIIALLHHHEIMPPSIYEYKPSLDRSSLQQPPLLHLLSSRILTSLSDAAWRAQEAEVIEESKTHDKYWFRPELASASYRVRVSGIKPEVWLELILWSCLHGGWIVDGVSILKAITRNEQQGGLEAWKPMSWRDRLSRSLPSSERDDIPDLASLKYVFDTHAASTMDLDANAAFGLERTISSEVVSAYVEALVNNVRIGVGERGISPVAVLNYLVELRSFLSQSKNNLSNRSWDATVLRLADSGGIDLEQSPRIAEMLPMLCPSAGEELRNLTTQSKPPYLWYGSSLPHGIMHRSMDVQTRDGNLDGALRVFKALQDRTDHDKYRSIVSFFESQASSSETGTTHSGFFMSPNSSSPDEVRAHPSLEHELPSSNLAMLMGLLLDAEAYNVANWFLYSNDVDGPVISPERYADPTLAPALARLAIHTDNKDLLQQVMQSPRTHDVLSEVLNAHFRAGKWDSAARVLKWTGDQQLPGFRWRLSNLVALADVMTSRNLAALTRPEGTTARQIFAHILRSDDNDLKPQFDSVLLVLFAAHKEWASFIGGMDPEPRWLRERYTRFQISPSAFNSILQFIMRTYGLSAGQALLYAVWPRNIRSQQRRANTPSTARDAGGLNMSKRRQTSLERAEMTRNILRVPHYSKGKIVMYDGLRPNIATLRLFISCLSKEMSDPAHLGAIATHEQHPRVRQHIDWIARLYHEYGLSASNFENDLRDVFDVESIELDWEIVALASRHFR
ncbi:hypothetical protein K431DRAFT_281539 [Polychaeton citri CBS 116435]|uniref:Uncharacterized protein n=1 Tax=Polychaeton citri CBS 116435 TaxID=1314669 RepID=A0A9P4QHN4_9PEZI|nr:hypothetical protein K431DRAFT_281539 [Polychaeton citri CBS 116435]